MMTEERYCVGENGICDTAEDCDLDLCDVADLLNEQDSKINGMTGGASIVADCPGSVVATRRIEPDRWEAAADCAINVLGRSNLEERIYHLSPHHDDKGERTEGNKP